MIYIFETRYVKKYGVGRGGGADQNKNKQKKTKIRASTLDFLVMYCDRMVKTVYIDQAESTLFPGKYNI